VISADTSVLVRYLVGTPAAPARRAAELIDGEELVAVSPVALVECAHVLRTQYGVDRLDIIESQIGLLQRENVRLVGQRADLLLASLVRARSLPGRPIPDAFIVAAALDADALPLATFDRAQARYGVEIREP
jgi:predicted nucleic acid-binding protein